MLSWVEHKSFIKNVERDVKHQIVISVHYDTPPPLPPPTHTHTHTHKMKIQISMSDQDFHSLISFLCLHVEILENPVASADWSDYRYPYWPWVWMYIIISHWSTDDKKIIFVFCSFLFFNRLDIMRFIWNVRFYLGGKYYNNKLLTLVLLNLDMSCLFKQCRSRSAGFFRSQLIWICTVCPTVFDNLYKQPGSSDLIGWKLKVCVAS